MEFAQLWCGDTVWRDVVNVVWICYGSGGVHEWERVCEVPCGALLTQAGSGIYPNHYKRSQRYDNIAACN